jgi:hypothetical protein
MPSFVLRVLEYVGWFAAFVAAITITSCVVVKVLSEVRARTVFFYVLFPFFFAFRCWPGSMPGINSLKRARRGSLAWLGESDVENVCTDAHMLCSSVRYCEGFSLHPDGML